MIRPTVLRAAACALLLLSAAPALAQNPPAAPPPPEPIDRGEPDLPFIPAEPDFTLAALPTTLRLPAGRWAFRVAHRFTRPLGQGDFGDLASDLFGIDGGAIVGLELRYGLLPGTQLVLLRTSDRTIQLMAQQSLIKARETGGLGLDAIAAVQGFDNLTEDYTGIFGALVSYRFGERAAVYAEPMFVLKPLPESATAEDSAVLIGFGARARLTPSMYVVGEFAPRLSGPDPGGDPHVSFAIESRRGGHSFQINVSNSYSMTLGQVARSYGATGEWLLGFNISRKFY